jgi:multicomponent Na+:H+ antiporter subunit D
LPIIYVAWFMPETVAPKKEHGEAPLAMVIALSITALLALGFFFYNAPVLDLERQLVEVMQ